VVRYFYSWTPIVASGAVVFAGPWLAGIVLFILLVPIAVLGWGIVAAPFLVVRWASRRLRSPIDAREPSSTLAQPMVALSQAERTTRT
jgi:hypothetical protein